MALSVFVSVQLFKRTLKGDCVTVQHGGKDIESRCSLYRVFFLPEGWCVCVCVCVWWGGAPPLLIAEALACLGYQQAPRAKRIT